MIYQLWGLPQANADSALLLSRLKRLEEHTPAAAVICGPGAEKELYTALRELIAPYGTELCLWLPVNSEMDELGPFDPLIDAHGNDFMKNCREKVFRFRCPGSRRNLEIMLRYYENMLPYGVFDGVFLDRIRYPSFQYGLSGVFACFCPQCRKSMEEYGLDPEKLRKACLRAEAAAGEEDPFRLTGYEEGRWLSSDRDLQALLDWRCRVIAEQTKTIVQWAARRGLKTALDLFTPSLGYFAGQSFKALLPLASFAKPMLYLRTDAPAGLPYELRMLSETLGEKALKHCLRLLGADSVHTLAAADAAQMRNLRDTCSPGTQIAAGFEYNRVVPVAPVTPETLKEDVPFLDALQLDGLCASWNLYSAPDENIAALCGIPFRGRTAEA